MTELQLSPLSGVNEWPTWKRRIRDLFDYHDEALNLFDGKFVAAELLQTPSEEQRKEFKERSIITSALTKETYLKIIDKKM